MGEEASIRGRMERLVASIEHAFSPGSFWVRKAFLTVPRHRFIRRRGTESPEGFVPVDRFHPTGEDLDQIYADKVVMIHDPPSSASQPYVVVKMLEWLDLKPGMRVLEIGTGSGFNAALLAEGTGDPRLVHTIDIQDDLVAEAREHLAEAGHGGVVVRAGDGGLGMPDAAPFDRIIVTAGSGDIPPAWLDQLAEGGVLVMPFATPPIGDLQLRVRKTGGELHGEFLSVFFFMSLQGMYGQPASHQVRWDLAADRSLQEVFRAGPAYSCGMSWAHRGAFWLFARGQADWFARLQERWHRLGSRWVSVMSDPRAGLYVHYDDHGRLNVYGRPGPVWNFATLVERWKSHGWPSITDYAVTIERGTGGQPGPGEWMDRRPSVTLRIRVRERVS